MQVYLPDDLYAEVKAQNLPASELLQQAVRAELRRRVLLEETDRYIEELVAEVGAPTARDLAAAEDIVARLALRKADTRAG
jgi:post-segregation antitoxin (ccd killing protein)